ncbi:MAG: carbohydrate-binding domain-containing protein [Ruminiclostridium sp.]
MKKRFIAVLCITAVLVSGCTADKTAAQTDSANTSAETNVTITAVQTAEMTITETNIEISPMNGVTQSGNVFTITKGGSYTVSGDIAEGQIVVDSKDDVELVLNGVNINNPDGPAIYAKNGDLTITLSAGSENNLWDGASYNVSDDENNPNAVVFTQDDLTITGTGALNVNGSYKNGINCKDALVIESGTVTVVSADNGIIGKESVVISDGVIAVNSTGDGIKATAADDTEKGFVKISGGTLNIISGEDGISAETDLDISGGSINIVSGGGSANGAEHTQTFGFFEKSQDTSSDEASTKSVKGCSSVTISAAALNLDSAEDCVHSNGTVTVNSGTLQLSSGDDGVHADTRLVINDGTVNIAKCYEGLESAYIEINGGDIDIIASDDGINVSSENDSDRMGGNLLLINGGDIYVNAEGDGLDMNGSGKIEGGTVIVDGPTNSGNGALDYDGSFAVNGGTLITCGSSGMAMTPSVDSALNTVSLTESLAQGNIVTVKDSDGNEIMSYTVNKTAGNITFTSDKLVTGEALTVFVDGTEKGTVTISDKISYIGSAAGQSGWGGMGGHGGGMGGFGREDGGFGGKFGGEKPNNGTRPEMPSDGTLPEMPDGTRTEMPNDGIMT